jgi:hypothetical protein
MRAYDRDLIRGGHYGQRIVARPNAISQRRMSQVMPPELRTLGAAQFGVGATWGLPGGGESSREAAPVTPRTGAALFSGPLAQLQPPALPIIEVKVSAAVVSAASRLVAFTHPRSCPGLNSRRQNAGWSAIPHDVERCAFHYYGKQQQHRYQRVVVKQASCLHPAPPEMTGG